ncbi:MAG: hypothetical protein ACREGJ_03175 [Candidatus Saccharimonadales bacterium]
MNFRLTSIVIRPSFFSFITCAVLATIILGVFTWASLLEDPLFYDYFWGPFGVVTILETSPDSLSAIMAAISAHPLTYNAVIFVAALLAGIIVYIVLQTITRATAGISNTLDEMHRANQTLEREMGTRIAFRVGIALLWVLYLIFFVKVLVPFCTLIAQSGFTQFYVDFSSAWGSIALGLGLLVLGLHVHVIFMRLLALRPRVFGNNAVIVSELYD